ncbi:MAG: hypothetical protein DHS20C13_08660 [Thermodesulfobacteriota bacterium]|nr:MAG: hypothetical protein DHS20C13_08660 [Thermodesulfobacteriota bacterium]
MDTRNIIGYFISHSTDINEVSNQGSEITQDGWQPRGDLIVAETNTPDGITKEYIQVWVMYA